MKDPVYIGARFKDPKQGYMVQVWEARTGEQIGEYKDGDPKIPEGCIIYDKQSHFIDAMHWWSNRSVFNRRYVG